MKINCIACIGAGYVGGPSMAVIAQQNPKIKVIVVDINPQRIAAWNNEDLDRLPVYEPGLKAVISEARNRNLFFSTDIDQAIDEADMIFTAVNTPTKTYGEGKGMGADLQYIELSARNIARIAKNDKIVVEKSTLPVRTAETLKAILDNNSHHVKFQILSNPEFLAEGTAVTDLLKPDRVLIGGETHTQEGREAIQALVDIYASWVPTENIITTNVWSSELSKLVANAFLAQRISSINAMSELCEVTGADIHEVAHAIGRDKRIGSKFLKASPGFGGSCFQKDILNLVYIARTYGLHEVADYWEQVIIMNNHQKTRFARNIVRTLFNTIAEKKITFLGWAFKKNTNDTRESAAIYIADLLLEEHANITVYDPKVTEEQIYTDLDRLNTRNPEINRKRITVVKDPYKACENAHAVAILTEWDEFTDYDYRKIYDLMTKPAFLFDGRDMRDRGEMENIGFKAYSLGRGIN